MISTLTQTPPNVNAQAADVAEIQHCFDLLFRPDDVFEVRALEVPSGRYKNIVSGWFNRADLAAQAAAMCDSRGPTGVFVTINPCDAACLARRNNRVEDRPKETTQDDQITRRVWLNIDIDPTRMSGVPATEAEKQAARDMATAVEDLLRQWGFPYPLIADSGNGVYLLYRIDLPNDPETAALLKRFLEVLAAVVQSPGAEIDTIVYNASRLIRVGGTWNRKGDGTPDRPHRRCRYHDPIPECPVDVVPVEKIRAFIAHHEPAPKAESSPGGNGNGNGRYDGRLDVGKWLRDRNVEFRTKDTADGTLYLVQCPFDPDHGKRGESAVMQAKDGTLAYKCHHQHCSGRRWVDYRDAIGKPDGDHYDPPRNPLYGTRQDKSFHEQLDEQLAEHSACTQRAFGGRVKAETVDGGESPEPPPFAKLIPFDDFLTMQFADDELIPGVVVGGQPGVIGARLKCMKTHMACEVAVSLASKTPFCGHFPVARECRVGLWSGESGRKKLQRILKAQRETHGITGPIPLFLNFSLPKLSLTSHLDVLHEVITQNRLDVCIFDPLYMALLTASNASLAGNVYAMGVVLEPLTKLGQDTNCTMETCHHFKKTAVVDQDEPCSLEELSQAGVAEWAGQWILLARRSPYKSDGKHELFMRVGGRAGHASFWALDIDEGHPADGPGGQKWDVGIRPVSDARAEAKQAAEKRKIEQRENRDTDDRRKMLESMRRCPEGETLKELSKLSGLSNERGSSAIRTLLGEGRIRRIKFKKYRRMETGYVALE